MTVDIPGLGAATTTEFALVTEPRPVPVLGRSCSFAVDGYEPEHAPGLVAC